MTGPSHNKEQKEKLEVLFNDNRVRKDTMHSRSVAEADEIRGRFAQHEKSTVIGSTPVPQYPAGPNWANDPVPPEEPLGIDVNEIEPVGEKFEIERASVGASHTNAPRGAGVCSVGETPTNVETPQPTPTRRRSS